MKWILLLQVVVCLFSAEQTLAQRIPPDSLPRCATPDLTNGQRRTLSSQAAIALSNKLATNGNNPTITYVPIRPHILRASNGTGGMTMAKLNNIMAITNSYYQSNGSGIQFYFCGTTPDYVDNDNLYGSFPAFDESGITGRDAPDAMNQYYVSRFNQSNLGGYAHFPEDTVASTRSFIINEMNETDLANRLLPHELGHNFGLFHTFGNYNSGTPELVTRGVGSNCLTTGDELCDTPADPYYLPGASTITVNGCPVYNGTAKDAQGASFTPSITNIMSYYFPCTHDFTAGQYDRMQAGLALRETHKSYTLGCPPSIVTAVSNLTASIVNATVVLTWQDNATNEMGYFIERSTSATSGFAAIGGVAPNATTFTDQKITGFTTYFYRVRPSNATTVGVSPAFNITTPLCHPQYTTNCSSGDGLGGFVLNGTVLSQNSGCSPNNYTPPPPVSTTLTAGQSTTFTGTFISTNYKEGVTVWADFNRNGSYDSSPNELIYQTLAPQTAPFSGTLTLPTNLTPGPLSIRVIVQYNAIPTDPCGLYDYGETEDYTVMVVSPPPSLADLSLSMRVGNRSPMLNQPVDYSLTITNSGPANATGVSWQNQLPPGLMFVGGDAGVVSSGTAVSGNGLSVAVGSSVTIGYQLNPTQPGTYVNAAQIMSSNQTDPDSQPGSGTGDGQDDAAFADMRTMTNSDAIFTSPNPNQTPLPAVASNQPTPDPAQADLSLAMAVSNRTPALGQAIIVTITVSNAGGLSASNVVVRDTLWGITASNLPSGLTVAGNGAGYTIINGTIASVAAGSTATLTFTASPTISGYIRNAAQIWSAGQPDPDSTPGSATPNANNFNGEDDTAQIDLRVGS